MITEHLKYLYERKMENNKSSNESLTAEELKYFNRQFRLLILNDTNYEWFTFEKELRQLVSKGFVFKMADDIFVSGFYAESYFAKPLIKLIIETKNELVREQLYHRVADLRQIEKKLMAKNENATLLNSEFFTAEGKTIFYKKPDNIFIEALILIHLGSILTY